MKTRRICPLACALSALLLAGCDANVFSSPPGERDRALVVAEEIVTAMAKYYADAHNDGVMRAFAVDPTLLDLASDPDQYDSGYIFVPTLEDALRSVAEQFPSERASWLLRIQPVAKNQIGPDISYSLHAGVIDYHASHCCVLVVANLARDEDGWKVLGVYLGGHGEETDEFRRERLARGAELLR